MRISDWSSDVCSSDLHAVCDEQGRPCVLLLTPGNVHDCKVAEQCIAAMPPSAELVADKGYDSQALREWLEARGTQAVIPPRRNRKIQRSEEHTSELQSLMRISYAVFCLKKKNTTN